MVNSPSTLITNPDPPSDTSKFTPTKRLNKRQRDFIVNWTDFNSETFGNTYQSALKAGYSDSKARVLTAHSHEVEWVQEAVKYMNNYNPLHIVNAFQSLSKSARADRDKIQALDRLAKIKGMYIEQVRSEVNVNFTNNVPRPTVIDVTEVESREQPKE